MAAEVDLRPVSALDVVEQGTALFRHRFVRDAWLYYAGAVPFVAGCLWSWSRLSAFRATAEEIAGFAVLLTALYVLKAYCHSLYTRRLLDAREPRPLGGSRIWRAANRVDRAMLHFGVRGVLWLLWCVTLPVLIAVTPLYVAIQYLPLVTAKATGAGPWLTLRQACRLGLRWYLDQQLLLLIVLATYLILFINFFVLELSLPMMARSLFGIESEFARAGLLMLSTSVAAAAAALAYLALGPVVKAMMVVSWYELDAQSSGLDLLERVDRLRQSLPQPSALAPVEGRGPHGAARLLALLICATALVSGPGVLRAPAACASSAIQGNLAAAEPAAVISYQAAVRRELARPAYRWHARVEDANASPSWWENTWIGRALRALRAWAGRVWRALVKAIERLWRWIFGSSSQATPARHPVAVTRWGWILVGVSVAAALMLLWFTWQRGQRKRAPQVTVRALPTAESLETALASDRSQDEWLALADQLRVDGDFRLALRAAFLACLAALGARQLLAIRRDRTNLEYVIEFRRRLRRVAWTEAAAPTVGDTLAELVGVFERVWYGNASVDAALLDDFLVKGQQVLAYA